MSENLHNYSSSSNCTNCNHNYLVHNQNQDFLRRNPDMERLEEYSRKQSEMIQTLTQALANEKKRNQIMALLNEVDNLNLPPQSIGNNDENDQDIFNIPSEVSSSQDSLIVHPPNSAKLMKVIFSKTSIGSYSSSTCKPSAEILPEKSRSRYGLGSDNYNYNDNYDGSNSVSGLRLKGKSASGIQLFHPNVNTNISCRSRSFSTSKSNLSNFNMAGNSNFQQQHQYNYPMYQYAYPGFNYPGADLTPPKPQQMEKLQLRVEPSKCKIIPGPPIPVKSSISPILIPGPPKKINSRVSDKVIFPIPDYNSNPTVGGRCRKPQLKIPWQIRETARRMTTAYLDEAEIEANSRDIKNKESFDLNGNGHLDPLTQRRSIEVNRAEVSTTPPLLRGCPRSRGTKSRRNIKRSKSKIKDQCFILVKNNPAPPRKTTTTTTSTPNPTNNRLLQNNEKRVRITEPSCKDEDSEDNYPDKNHGLEVKLSRHVKEDTSLIDAIMTLCQEHRNRHINGQNGQNNAQNGQNYAQNGQNYVQNGQNYVQSIPKNLNHQLLDNNDNDKKESNEVLSLFRKFSRNDGQKSTIINDVEELDDGHGGPPFAQRKKIQHKTMLDDLGSTLDKMLLDKEVNLQNKRTKYAHNVQKFFKNEPVTIKVKPSVTRLQLPPAGHRSQVNYNDKTNNKTIQMIFQNQKKIRTTSPSIGPKVPGSRIFPKSELERNKSFLQVQIEKLRCKNHNIPEGFEETLIYLAQTLNLNHMKTAGEDKKPYKLAGEDKKPSKSAGEPPEELFKMIYHTQTLNHQKKTGEKPSKSPPGPAGEPLEELSKMLKIESEKLEKRRKFEETQQDFPRWLKSKFEDSKKSSINHPKFEDSKKSSINQCPKAINGHFNYRKSLNLSDLTLEDRAKFKININPRGVDCNCCLDHRQNILNFIHKKKPPVTVDFEATKSKFKKYFVQANSNVNAKGSAESPQEPSISSSTFALIDENINNNNITSNQNDVLRSKSSINCPKNIIKISKIPFQ